MEVPSRCPAPRPRGWRLAIVLAAMIAGSGAAAQEIRYLRLGTGTAGGSHFQAGGLIAGAISNPPGAPPCERGGSCGVPGVIAIATATEGSTANAEALGAGRLELALVEADVAQWAIQGLPPFSKPIPSLRAIAHLTTDQIHLVARRDAAIALPHQLRGKRVSLGAKGSGTLVHARRVLAAWGLRESDLKAVYLGPPQSADDLAADRLDAFFVVDEAPVPAVAELARTLPLTLVPLAAEGAEKLRKDNHLLFPEEIPAGTYEGQTTDLSTLAVGVDLLTTADQPEALVHDITRALWHPSTIALLSANRPPGAPLRRDDALTGIGVMPHMGALRYYHDSGMAE